MTPGNFGVVRPASRSYGKCLRHNVARERYSRNVKSLPRFVPNWPIVLPAMWGAFAVWVYLLLWASCRAGDAGTVHPIFYFDKILHFTFFAGGAMALGACLRGSTSLHWSVIFLVVIITQSVLGVSDEINQLRFSGRSGGDPFDWLADLLGSAFGLIILRQFFYERPRSPHTTNSGTPG